MSALPAVASVSHVVGLLGGPIVLVNGGDGDGHGWIGPAVIAAFVASPVVVGLAWRLVDRRRGRRTDDDA